MSDPRIVTPLTKRPEPVEFLRECLATDHIRRVGMDFIDLVPPTIEDAYNFIGVTMQIRHAVYDMPNVMTLSRFRYLLTQYRDVMKLSAPMALDPFVDMTSEEQKMEMKFLDKDVFDNLNNTMVFCVVSSGQSLIDAPLDNDGRVVPFVDKYRVLSTEFGYLQVIYRCFEPYCFASESVRRCMLRAVAANHPSLSVRSMMLLVDMKFPLSLIPGVGNALNLEFLACDAPSLQHLALI